MVQLYKPDLNAIRQQAEAAREAEKNRKERNDFKWGDLKEGENHLRLLPPTNSRGVIETLVAKHYFSDTALSSIVQNHNCIAQMFAHIPNVQCRTCNTGDRLLAQMPNLEIKRWHSPGIAYYVQAVDRNEPKPVPRLYRLTPHVKNWLSLQMEACLKDGVDITDLQQGIDIKITKTTKKTKRGERTNYTSTLWAIKGPSPLHEDPAVVKSILDGMIDPNQIWKYPDDAGLAELNKYASDIFSYYVKDNYAHPGAKVVVPGVSTPQDQSVTEVRMPVQPVVVQSPVQVAQPVVVQTPVQVQQPVQEVKVPAVQAAAAIASIAAGNQLPLVPQKVITPPTAVGSRGAASPSDKPVCFGGAAPRPDGGLGYDDTSEICLMCPHELQCEDACKAAAKGVA